MKYILSILIIPLAFVSLIMFFAFLENYSIGKRIGITALVFAILAIPLCILLFKVPGKLTYILALACMAICSLIIFYPAYLPESIRNKVETKTHVARLDQLAGKYEHDGLTVLVTNKETQLFVSGEPIANLGLGDPLRIRQAYDHEYTEFLDSHSDPAKYVFKFDIENRLIIWLQTPSPTSTGAETSTKVGNYLRK